MKNYYVFIENENLFKYVMSSMYFNETKKEREILELWRKGVNNCDIGKQVGYTEGTIRNRKKELTKRINKFLLENNMNCTEYCVYKHIFPNGKIYVGMTKNIKKRWKKGLGYENNEKMYNDILMYGWINIKHIIIKNNLTYEEAHELENKKIRQYKSYMQKYGYNTNVILKDKEVNINEIDAI